MFRVCKDADLCKWVYYEIDWRSLDCVINDLYDLVILFKYIIVMMNWIVLIWLFDPCFFLLWRNEIILICECPSDYLKIVEVTDVEDGEYDWIEGNGG